MSNTFCRQLRFFHALILAGVIVATGSLSLRADESARSIRLSLSDAVRMSQDRHIDVLVADERVQQAIARLDEARSVLWPRVTSSASHNRQTKNLEAAGISLPGRDPLVGPFNSFDARLKLTQTLFDAAAIQRLRAAKAGRRLSVAQSVKAKQDAMALVATLYVEAERATESLEAAHAVLERSQARWRLAKARLALGIASALDVSQADAELADSRHRWRAAIAEAIERRMDFGASLGLPIDCPVVFDDGEASGAIPTTGRMTAAVQEHPDVVAARQQVEALRLERAAESADGLPKISASADYGASGRVVSDSEATYTLGAQISMPVFEGGLRAARVREATARLRESKAQLAEVTRQTDAALISARQGIAEAVALVESTHAALATAAEQLALATERLRAGIGSELEWIEASTQAQLAKDRASEAAAASQIAQVNLARALGQVESLVESRR